MAEHRTVDADVVGSTPISHPYRKAYEIYFISLFLSNRESNDLVVSLLLDFIRSKKKWITGFQNQFDLLHENQDQFPDILD